MSNKWQEETKSHYTRNLKYLRNDCYSFSVDRGYSKQPIVVQLRKMACSFVEWFFPVDIQEYVDVLDIIMDNLLTMPLRSIVHFSR